MGDLSEAKPDDFSADAEMAGICRQWYPNLIEMAEDEELVRPPPPDLA
jgi:hypothetical protein